MSGMSFDVVEDRTYIIKRQMNSGAKLAIRKAGLDIEAKAKENVTINDTIDTGSMRASIFFTTGSQSNYDKAKSEAEAAAAEPGRKSGQARSIQMAPEERPEDDLTAIIAVGVEHGIYVELGTVDMDANPYLTPAAEEVMGVLDEVLAKYINREVKE